MRTLLVGLAPIVGLFLSTAASAATLMAHADGAGALTLLDPTQPVGPGNPATVVTGLTPDEESTITPFFAATISGTTARNIRTPRLAFVKLGQVFVIKAVSGMSNAPKRISSISDACGIDDQAHDFSSVDLSWVMVRRDGADNICFNGDDVRTAIKLNAAVTANGITPAGLTDFYPTYDAAGAITGFLSVEGTPKALKRRNALFASPTQLLALANGNVEHNEYTLSHLFLKLTVAGQPQAQLFRWDHSDALLSPALYTFASTTAGGVSHAASNPNNLFFGDGAQLLRISANSMTPGGAVLTSSVPGGAAINRVALGSGNAVFAANSGVYSAPRDGANAPATVLKTGSVFSGTLANLVTAAGDFVFINFANFFTSKVTAVRVMHDGTAPQETLNSYWAGLIGPSSVDFATTSNFGQAANFMVKANKSGGNDTLRLVSTATGLTGKTMGVVSNTVPFQAVFSFGVGRYVGAVGFIQRDAENSDSDTFVFDTTTGNSLQPVLNLPGFDAMIYGGH